MSIFSILKKTKNKSYRAGVLKTPHGAIETPCFIPVGTAATVKALTPQQLKEIGAQIVLANTYHLMLRPGASLVEKMGGAGKFMGWTINRPRRSNAQDLRGREDPLPTMTDSGGFQVFSLGIAQTSSDDKVTKFTHDVFLNEARSKVSRRLKPAKIDEDGVTFYSHIDGKKHRLDPRISIDIQEKLGADLIVAFDDHESPLWSYEKIKASLMLTNRWASESLGAYRQRFQGSTSKRAQEQLMYGVIHGSHYEDLRKESAKFTERYFNAIAIGGAYQSKENLYKVIDWVVPLVSEDKPRHLLGIGEVEDLFNSIERGIDFFDCVAPTRRARHGNLYISPKNGGNRKNNFSLSITNEKYFADKNPIDPDCLCYACQNFTRAYLRHLFLAQELLAYTLASYHNMYFITNLVKNIREAILEDTLEKLKKIWM